MPPFIRHFLRDESGAMVVGEWVFVATLLMLGAVAGAAALQAPPDESTDATAAASAHPAAAPVVADHH